VLSVVAVILLGISKGGFLGLGVMSLPLMSLFVPPLQAAAIILPTMLAQDVLTVWAYRKEWSALNLKIMIPSMTAGIGVAALFAASDVLKIPAYGALGQLTLENLAVGLLLLPVAIASNYAGIWLVRRTPAEMFFRIAYVLMFLISIELIRSALAQLL